MLKIAKFKIRYSGFAYVEADSIEEAEEMYSDRNTLYEEWQINEVIEVDEFNEEV